MFKMEMKWYGEGEWIPTVFTPTDYASALKRYQEYQGRHPEHLYRIFPTGASK